MIVTGKKRLNGLLPAGIESRKLATFSRFIAYIEPYLSLGAGLAKTDTHNYLTLVPGIGFRIFFKEWFSMRVDFRDYLYNEQYLDRSGGGATNASRLSNNYAVMVSLSFWLPKMPSF